MSDTAIALLKRLIDVGIDAPSAHCPSPPPPPPSPPPADGGVRRIEREFEVEIEREVEREVEEKTRIAPEPPREKGALDRSAERADLQRAYT